MKNETINNIIRFIGLFLLQIVVLNNINFWGYINPYLYILFVALYPILSNINYFLIISFIFGMLLDIAMDSGGIHSSCCVIIAFSRPLFLRFCFGHNYTYQITSIESTDIIKRIIYCILILIIQHLFMFSFEFFSIYKIDLILSNTLYSGIFSILLAALGIIIFTRDN